MTDQLAERLSSQARYCGRMGSSLTEALLLGAADDLLAGGPTATLLAPHAQDPAGSVPGLRLAGSLHRLVLERRAPLLATHYPSVGGTADPTALWPAARQVVAQQADVLAEHLRRPVQTNEVGRAAALWGLLTQLGPAPVRLLEIGSSAGLNLRCDAFAYRIGGVLRGEPGSRVVLDEPWTGDLPAGAPGPIVDRLGCDPAPLDPTSTADRLTLTSYVWADQVERFERLRGALDVAARVAARVERAGAAAFLRAQLPGLPGGPAVTPGLTTVVWHSVVQQYLSAQERAEVEALLEQAGRQATRDAPLVQLSMEPAVAPEQVAGSGDPGTFPLVRRSWPGGQAAVVGHALGHGPPIRWTAPTATRSTLTP